MISRRQLLYYFFLSLCYPFLSRKHIAVAGEVSDQNRYRLTVNVLKKAYWAEILATRHYDGYSNKALNEKFPNIAYLFHSLSISEKIHARNYKRLILALGAIIEEKEIPIRVATTKKNLQVAARKELEKITEFYPKILEELLPESHDLAVVNCEYSWKSHREHEEMIKNIKTYSGIFFKPLARKIEGMTLEYYVCEVCGSTTSKKPKMPCEICSYPPYHQKKIEMPKV